MDRCAHPAHALPVAQAPGRLRLKRRALEGQKEAEEKG
jgi:hypothetical protein